MATTGQPSSPASSSEDSSVQTQPKTSKRTRGSIACTSCRKQKARCEIVQHEGVELLTCKRCQNLHLNCSLADSDSTAVRVLKNASGQVESEKANFNPSGPPLAEDGQPKRWAAEAMAPQLRMWHFLCPDDNDPIPWSAPVLAMHTLVRRQYGTRRSQLQTTDTSLRNILTESQIDQLLDIFDLKHVPWLNFEPSPKGKHELLDAVRCSIASRHLPTIVRVKVAGRLQALCHNMVAVHIINPDSEMFPPIEVIQALHILGVWSHIQEEADGGFAETRTLISSAVGLAMDMRINQLSSLPHAKESPELRAKAALWLSISVFDSLTCVGKGRLPVSRRSKTDTAFFEIKPPTNLREARETRLAIFAQVMDIAEAGASLTFNPQAGGLAAIHKTLGGMMMKMEQIYETAGTLTAITDYEKPYFQIMMVGTVFCSITILYHAIFEVRYAYRDVVHLPHQAFKLDDLHVLNHYGTMAFKYVEKMLSGIVEGDPETLANAPDTIFGQQLFVCCLVVALKNFLRVNNHPLIANFSDQLILKTAQKLMSIAPTKDHPAAKCGKMMEIVAESWIAFTNGVKEAGPEHKNTFEYICPLAANFAAIGSQRQPYDIASLPVFSQPATPDWSHLPSPSTSPSNFGSLAELSEFNELSPPTIGSTIGQMASTVDASLSYGQDRPTSTSHQQGLLNPYQQVPPPSRHSPVSHQYNPTPLPFDPETYAMLNQLTMFAPPQLSESQTELYGTIPQGDDFWQTFEGMMGSRPPMFGGQSAGPPSSSAGGYQ